MQLNELATTKRLLYAFVIGFLMLLCILVASCRQNARLVLLAHDLSVKCEALQAKNTQLEVITAKLTNEQIQWIHEPVESGQEIEP